MINRVFIRCATCNQAILTRTAIGQSDYQEFAFPCPGCGVEIRFGMDLDQEAATFQYREPTNAVWDEAADDVGLTMTFDAEILVPADPRGLVGDMISPFILMCTAVRDIAEYKRGAMHRMRLLKDLWPVLRNCHIHFTNRRWDLYRQEFQLVDPEFDEEDEVLLVKHHFRNLHRFSAAFRPQSESMSHLLRQRVNYAESLSSKACNDLLRYLRDIGWNWHLFDELMGLKEQWGRVYEIVQPVYAYYDLADGIDIAKFTLSQKRFDDIKGFFVDCHETLCRISLIAGALEGIVSGSGQTIPDGGRSISLEEEYRAMANGRKKDVVTHWPTASAFAEMQANQLRNGVGHHSAKYAVATDSIEYRIENRSGVTSDTIRYMDFCLQLVKTYASVELASVPMHWVAARDMGLTGRVV